MTSDFRTIEISNPAYERDGLRYITIKTSNLRGRGDITLWLPDNNLVSFSPVTVVILLHGVYGSHWSWSSQGGAHRTADRLIQSGQIRPVVLAMPSDGLWGDGSAYLPHDGYSFDRWIIEDVPKAVSAVLSVNGTNTVSMNLCIAGLSMGGFGALRLAAAYPDRFRAAYGLSSITHVDQLPLFVEEPIMHYRQSDPITESVMDLMLKQRNRLPAIGFECGVDDVLIEPNRALHQTLTQQRIAHHYVEHPGGHNWPYWENHVADALVFFDQHLSKTSLVP